MITDLPSSFKHTVISDGILSACSQSPSKVAYKHGQKTRTYHELKQRIDSISGIIHSFQIPMKCNIAIVASNSIEYMEIVLARTISIYSIELDATIAILHFIGIWKEWIIPEIESILCFSSWYVLVFCPCLYATLEGLWEQADNIPSEITVCLNEDGRSVIMRKKS